MSVYLRRPKLSDDMNEEEVDQQQQQPVKDASAQPDNSRDYTKEFAVVNAKIAELERRFNAEKQPLINQRTAIMQAAAKAGISLITNEGAGYKFSSKLFESVLKNSKTDELISLIDSTFAALPDLSYYMDRKGCTSLAKRLLAFLNDQYWNDGQNHWSDVADFIRGTLGKANISLSTKEMMTFVDKLGELMKGHNMFVWIFGNQSAETPAPEDQEEPVETAEPELAPQEEEIPEQAVYFTGETEDNYDGRYFGEYGDLEQDDFPDDETYDGVNVDDPFFGTPEGDEDLLNENVNITQDEENELMKYATFESK